MMNTVNIIGEIKEPIDLVRVSLGQKVYVKCRNDKELIGILHVKIYNITYRHMMIT